MTCGRRTVTGHTIRAIRRPSIVSVDEPDLRVDVRDTIGEIGETRGARGVANSRDVANDVHATADPNLLPQLDYRDDRDYDR